MNTTDEQGSLALQRVEDQMAVVADREAELEADMRKRDDLIRDALEHGHSVEMMQAATGRSRAWVYAVRDGRRRP